MMPFAEARRVRSFSAISADSSLDALGAGRAYVMLFGHCSSLESALVCYVYVR